ncbi:SKP1-like protein 1A [Glycine soja]|uniref:SKP1-like protein 1A n=1 Tax=Glycine soja TaxID=3848 RepID=UPI00103A50B6|nr:SKP1-like protein 1A [Glycine soja]
MALTKNITLKSLDVEAFEVEEAVAVKSQMIKHMIEDNYVDNKVPLPNATNKILAEVIKYCKKHVDANCTDEKPSEDELKAWEADFVKVDQVTLFDLILVRGYMLLRLEGLGLSMNKIFIVLVELQGSLLGYLA